MYVHVVNGFVSTTYTCTYVTKTDYSYYKQRRSTITDGSQDSSITNGVGSCPLTEDNDDNIFG